MGRRWVEEEAARIGVPSKVIVAGPIPDGELPAYYHACDVFVLPSIAESEAFGIVQAEAMACGKPVINTWLPTGVPWVSLDGVTGITVPPSDSMALAKAIRSLLGDPALAMRLGEAGRQRVREVFRRDTMLEKVLEMYRKVASQG